MKVGFPIGAALAKLVAKKNEEKVQEWKKNSEEKEKAVTGKEAPKINTLGEAGMQGRR